VLLIGSNSFFWVAAYLGTLRAGLVCVPLPPSIHPDDLAQIVSTTEAETACVESGAGLTHLQAIGPFHLITDDDVDVTGARSVTTLERLLQHEGSAGPSFPTILADDLAALMFTSGSTGAPRGVMVSHGNIIANTTSIIQSLNLTNADRIMAVLPFHYCFGASLLHTHLHAGASLVVDSRFMYPEIILDRMIESECTGFAGVPTHFQTLLRNSTLRSRQFPHLRYVQQAGGHLAPALTDELRAALPGVKVFVMYGQTEATARLSCLAPELLDAKRGSIGKGIPGVSIRVVGEDGREVASGDAGEIVAAGRNITKGYWRNPQESLATFRNGTLYTGDLATVDDDGYIYIVGRSKDFLKCRGERIACQRLEARLLQFDEIVEAAVISVPDDVLGEAVKAFIVPRNQDDDGVVPRLQAFCRREMPAHLIPKDVVRLSSMPKSEAGKVLKSELARL